MARIAGVDIPREKRLEIALTYVFGIGRPTSLKVCAELGLNPDTRVRDLTDDEVNRIRVYVDQNLRVEGDLRRDVAQDIKRKIEIGSYQGVRHRKGLPVRGQRTHTNARTRKGPKKTVANKIVAGSGVDAATKVRDLSEDEVLKIRAFIDQNLKVEGDLRREVAQDIKRKIEIGCYQGIRHRRGLPVRGQRTHTNARTRKGPKKTIAGRKKAQAKK